MTEMRRFLVLLACCSGPAAPRVSPLEVTTEHKKTVPLSPIVGLVAVGAGVVLVVTGSKTRV